MSSLTTSTDYMRIVTGLRACRDQIEKAAFLIAEAHEKKIWEKKFSSFREFLEKECGISRSWGYELLGRNKATQELLESGSKPESQSVRLPDTESGKSLGFSNGFDAGNADPEERPHIVAAVLERSNGKLTARGIAEEVEKPKPGFKPAKAPEPVEAERLDSVGREIPKAILPLWTRSEEVQALLTQISRIKGILKKADEDGDLVFAEVTCSGAIADLARAYTSIQCAKPFAVCTTCQGKTPVKCTFCKGRGFISEFRYKTMVPKEIKAMREKAAK